MKLLKQVGIVFLGLFALALAGCSGGGDDGSGVQSTTGVALVPGGLVLAGPSDVAGMDITATKLVLQTNGTDELTFTVFVKDQNSVALSGKTILVSSTGGALEKSSMTSDPDGTATVKLGIGSEKLNRQITVSFSAGGLIKTQAVTITGTTLTLASSKLSTVQGDSTVELTATLKDASGGSIDGVPVTFVSSLGNTFTALVPYTFTSGYSGATASGQFKARYNAIRSGSDTVTVTATGSTAQIGLTIDVVSQAAFHFIPPTPTEGSVVNVNTNHTLKVEYLDATGAGVNGKVLTFSAGKGTFGGSSTSTATTDAAGQAIVVYNTGLTAGPAVITVIDDTGLKSDTLNLSVRATTPTSISLQSSPSVVPVNIGGSVSTSTLTATVRDANSQAVAGVMVTFSIANGPGGGEFISPVTSVTDVGGNATATFTSGSSTSAQDGVEIRATLQGGVVPPATTFMTIGQKAATITIGGSNKISTVSVDGVEVGYALPYSVLVVDANGNPIQGATVSLGLYPVRFWTGFTITNGSIQTRDGVFLNEDINRNGILEVGEDGAPGLDPTTLVLDNTYWVVGSEGNPATVNLTQSGNGRLDPGGVATIPISVTTGPLGIAGFEVTYPKAYGGWIDIEITASTQVTGSTSVAKLESSLAVKQGDVPFPTSPFGYYPPVIGP